MRFFIILLLLPFPIWAQPDPKLYHTYQITNKTSLYAENFDDNSSGWLDSADIYGTISNGVLAIPNIDSASYIIEKSIDFEKDFEIEIVAKIEGKKPNKIYGRFAWGNECYVFGGYLTFSKNYVRLFNCQYGDCDHSRSKPLINQNKNDFNLYTIRKVGNTYYVFVNKKIIITHPYQKPKGTNLMITGDGNAKLVFDRITISYLEL